MRRLLARVACGLGLAALARRRTRRRLLVLMYHGVVEQPLTPFCWHQLPVAAFREQMAWVAARFTVLPLEEALAGLRAGTLPDHACAITFDDGYRSNRTLAEPVLAELGLAATVFLPTDVIATGDLLWPDHVYLALARESADDARVARTLDALKAMPRSEKDAAVAAMDPSTDTAPFELLDWDEVRQMQARGVMTFAPHSTTHEILSRCEDDEVVRQVGGSAQAIRDRLDVDPQVFAYPNGRSIDFDDRTRAALTAAGIPWAVSTVEGRNGPAADPLALRRTCVGADIDLATFALLASGWADRPEG